MLTEEQIKEIEDDLILSDNEKMEKAIIPFIMDKAPCLICGYNGSNYFQPNVHSCAKYYHEGRENPLKYVRTTLEKIRS